MERMAAAFDTRVRELQGAMSLLALPCEEQLEGIERSVEAVEASFDALRGAVQAEKQCLQHADALATRATEQAALLRKITGALPDELLLEQPPGSSGVVPALAHVSNSSSNSVKQPKAAKQRRPKSARKPPADRAPQTALDHVTQSDLDSLRRDVKGRLTVEKLNAGIDDLCQLMMAKQQLLASKRPSTLRHGDAQRVKDWRALVTPETERFSFFTENDLLDPPGGTKPSSTMVGATGKCMISALRSLGKIKELRVNRTKLYLVL